MNKLTLSYLRDPSSIRAESSRIFERVLENQSDFFELNLSKLTDCSNYMIAMMEENYPSGNIPFHSRWRHFDIEGRSQIESLKSDPHFPSDKKAQSRLFIELVIVSVLLDAGAGNRWVYHLKDHEKTLARSEGLAIASLEMYKEGLFSNTDSPFSVNVQKLTSLTLNEMKTAFQVSTQNPMEGLEGRVNLLKTLAKVMEGTPAIFSENPKLGLFFDAILDKTQTTDGYIDVSKLFALVLETFSPIWPGRIQLENQTLGDVWHYGPFDTTDNSLIPFHKLSQWLTYSLLEPLIWYGLKIENLDKLTGLPEYRNGGFFIDMGVIKIKDKALIHTPYPPHHDAIIEWRALTICLLDKLWDMILKEKQCSKEALPLVTLLQAGTWIAGRKLAYLKRQDGAPPIQIISDGTVF